MRYSAPVAALLCASLLAFPLPALAQSAAQADAKTQTLNVDARLVVVPVTVRDSKEKLVRTLTKDDFTLTVDAKSQNIRYFDKENNLPLTLGLMVDVSGSQRTVLDAERTASSSFLDNMLQPDRDKAFVIQFGRQADLLADVTSSMPKLQAALQKIDSDREKPQFNQDDRSDNGSGNSGNSGSSNNGGYGNGGYGSGGYGGQGRHGGGQRPGGGGQRSGAGGGTLLYDAVYLASTEVLPKPAKDAKPAGPSRRALILLTDGDDRGSRETLTDAIEAAQRADFTVYAIYYKGEQDHNGYGNGFPGRFPGGRGGFPGGGGRMGDQGSREKNDGKKILQRMTEETGGRMFEVTKKYTVADIYKDIAEELRSQYRLGFSPVNNDDGYHRLTVDIPKQKKLILQYRDGYYTGAPKQQ
ncbi:VWA domain-containing protein [Terriglobus roseus]|uniref:VWFA-related domain-containing protein n=1 Tax=Terriglobus roseus TaxID=392734 RepID=A0A1G7R1A1_9BACT|nr:VWA domain-containing protein [Terriglobus roseus]SDG03899.1 VWFA-related domain-containing protein [Terriglobus roseus]